MFQKSSHCKRVILMCVIDWSSSVELQSLTVCTCSSINTPVCILRLCSWRCNTVAEWTLDLLHKNTPGCFVLHEENDFTAGLLLLLFFRSTWSVRRLQRERIQMFYSLFDVTDSSVCFLLLYIDVCVDVHLIKTVMHKQPWHCYCFFCSGEKCFPLLFHPSEVK